MSFQIELNKYERAYGRFLYKIQSAIQQTFAQEEESRGLTQSEIARELDIDKGSVSRRLNGSGNITLRTISDLFTAMDREPLSNFVADGSFCQYTIGGPPTTTNVYIPVTAFSAILPMSHATLANGAVLQANGFDCAMSSGTGMLPFVQDQLMTSQFGKAQGIGAKELQYHD